MSDGNKLSLDPKQQQDPFALKQPEVCKPEPQGRLGEAWPIIIPEQIVGSTHQFEFPAPKNLSSVGAVGVISMDGSPELKADWGTPTFVPGMGTGPLKITYAPTSIGEKQSTVTLVMRWEDGHIEKRTIRVTAHARKLEDVPESEAAHDTTHKQPKPPVEKKAPDRVGTIDQFGSWLDVNNAYVRLMGEQRGGIELVDRESEKFKPKPAERSLWEELAEMAFQLGTGAIAGLVARYVASAVAKALVGAEKVAAAAKASEEGVVAAEKAANAAKGSPVDAREAGQVLIATKRDSAAKQGAAARAKLIEGEISANTSAAVTKVITSVATEIRGPQTPESAGGGEAQLESDGAPPASADTGIAFFSEQYSMNRLLAQTGAKRLNSILAERIKAHPEIAGDLMAGVEQGLNDAAEAQAREKQAVSTSAQFMTYLARTNLGTEKINTRHGAKTVTDMSKQRESGKSKLEPAELAGGVLEIVCDHNRGGDVRVTDARANNVSHLIVNRLLDQRLAHSGIPIRLSLYGGLTVITRDEAGRIRVAGGALELGPPYREEQQIQEAERIFHVVVSKTLKDWGVPQIHTNDASQGPDPKKESTKA